jgi:hypothetical protein
MIAPSHRPNDMMGQRAIAILSIGIALAGCAGRDQSVQFSGGVAAEQMSADVFRIKSSTNARNEDILLIAAEATKSVGATHFELISPDDANRRQVASAAPGTATSAIERAADSAHHSETTSAMIKPGRDAYIRVLRLGPGQQPPIGVFAVDELMKFVGWRRKQS